MFPILELIHDWVYDIYFTDTIIIVCSPCFLFNTTILFFRKLDIICNI